MGKLWNYRCLRNNKWRILHGGENIKFISSSQRVMFFLLYGENNSTKAKDGNRDVIERYDTHKGDVRKIGHSGPGWSGVWNLRVVWFPVKHSPPYNNRNYIISCYLTDSIQTNVARVTSCKWLQSRNIGLLNSGLQVFLPCKNHLRSWNATHVSSTVLANCGAGAIFFN